MAPSVQSWYLLNSGRGNYAFNMALDESLLECMPRLGIPVLRFYGWNEPAASFGYFQKYSDVARVTLLRPLVRRPTGGGVVPHDADWTYSLTFPCGHEWHALKAVESYQLIHEWIQSAFSRLQIRTELARNASANGTGQCFIGFEKSDLLWHGQKIAGAAQRRTRTGLLIQGSVQPAPPGLSRTEWQQAMCDVASGNGAQWSELAPDSELLKRACALDENKYSQAVYNQKK
jgi:lipoate-protein ligase A